MRSQRVDHRARIEPRHVVGADDCVVVFGNDVVDPRLELDQVIDTRQVDECPFHLSQESRLGVPSCRPGLENVLEALEPLVLVESSSVERTVLPRMNLELAGLNGLDRKSTRLNSSHLVISYAV